MDAEIHVVDDEPSHYYRLHLTPGPHSARHVRRIIRTYLHAWDLRSLVDAAELGATELLSNVVKHAPGSLCTVVLRRTASGLRLEVHDNNPELPRTGFTGDLAESGRGLVLLSAVAATWDAERTGPRTKVVWFELKP